MIKSYFKIFCRFLNIHLQSFLEYKKAFFLQVLGMALNNGTFIVFWYIIFERFRSSFASNNITFSEIMLLWGLASSSFGFLHIFFAGTRELSRYIIQGNLDIYLLYPKNPLFLLALSKSHASAWGDLLYGYVLFFVFVQGSPASLLIFSYFVLFSAIFMGSVLIILNCLTFLLGDAETLQETFFGSMITFGTYPEGIFSTRTKFLLFSVLPVGFYTYLPVHLIMQFNFRLFFLISAVDILALLIAHFVFMKGLKKYESGNLFYSHK